MRPNSAGSLPTNLLGTADCRKSALQARISCFQDKLTLKWPLQFSRPWKRTHIWFCGWVVLKGGFLKKKKLTPYPRPSLIRGVPFPPQDSSLQLAGLVLCSPGPGCAGKAVKMSTNQSFREKQWALEGRCPVTKHTPFMECWS